MPRRTVKFSHYDVMVRKETRVKVKKGGIVFELKRHRWSFVGRLMSPMSGGLRETDQREFEDAMMSWFKTEKTNPKRTKFVPRFNRT